MTNQGMFQPIYDRIVRGETVEIDCSNNPQYGIKFINWVNNLPGQDLHWRITVGDGKLTIRQVTGEDDA